MPQINHGFHSPLRYPGGKGSLANFMKTIVVENQLWDGDYVEVYAGGAAIAWSLLFEEYIRRVHINDLNKSLMAFWRSVVQQTEELCRLITDTPVTMDEWYRQRAIQDRLDCHSELELGFSTFFLNRTNRSGILRGGIIGGKNQAGSWKLDVRYNKSDLIRRIEKIARFSNRIRLYNMDASDFLRDVVAKLSDDALVYLDPPYFVKGQGLYENHYGPEDHAGIADIVSSLRQPWIVSYDACDPIDMLYTAYRGIRYHVSYSAQDRYKGAESMFFSPRLRLPTEMDNPARLRQPKMAGRLL